LTCLSRYRSSERLSIFILYASLKNQNRKEHTKFFFAMTWIVNYRVATHRYHEYPLKISYCVIYTRSMMWDETNKLLLFSIAKLSILSIWFENIIRFTFTRNIFISDSRLLCLSRPMNNSRAERHEKSSTPCILIYNYRSTVSLPEFIEYSRARGGSIDIRSMRLMVGIV